MKFMMPHAWNGGIILTMALALTMSVAEPTAAQQTTTDPKFDLTGNQVVNAADVGEAMEDWSAAYTAGSCAAKVTADFNADGCLDITDLQLLASQLGNGTTAAALRQASQPRLANVPEKTFVVNSSAAGRKQDAKYKDMNPGDGICATSEGKCTIMAAVMETNAPRVPPYRARINFDIRNADGSCPELVQIIPNADADKWLEVDDASGYGTILDGYTQCGASPNTENVSGNAKIRIEIVGTKEGKYPAIEGVNGLELKSPNNVVRGFALYNWARQIEISSPNAKYNHLEGNILGTNVTFGFLQDRGKAHYREGLRIAFGASYNVIGCGSFTSGGVFVPCTNQSDVNAARNIISGNGDDGIHLEEANTNHNRIVGNYIGLGQSGTIVRDGGGKSTTKNWTDGVDFEKGPQHNWLGGPTPAERNFIAGNQSDGIEVSHGGNTKNNYVVGNVFGLDVNGGAAGNGNNGISFEDTVNNNFAYDNIVSSNQVNGVRFYVLVHNTQVYNNKIGVGLDGVSPRGNGRAGVYIMGGSHHNLIRDNLIAYNSARGIEVSNLSDSDHKLKPTDRDGFGETYFNTLSRNSIFANNEEGIKLNDTRDYPNVNGNQSLPSPEIVAANTQLAVGKACPNCKIEIFISDKGQVPDPNDDDYGEGKTFIGDGMSNGAGQFAITINGITAGQLITATSTDSLGNTSAFAYNVAVTNGPVATLTPAPTVTPSPIPVVTRTPGPAPEQPYRLYAPITTR
jgi:hypothetical protein